MVLIGTATATMFILSFPTSLFGIPVLAVVGFVLGVDPNSIQGMYVNLFMLFLLGLVQWFWIVPRVWRHDPDFQVLDLPAPFGAEALPDSSLDGRFEDLKIGETSPVERVINEDDG